VRVALGRDRDLIDAASRRLRTYFLAG
jgi:hypothetical protein